MTTKPLISLVMIVKNEEKVLPACLASVKDIVDEYVIVDTGSTDGTAAVIAQYTEAVHSLPFEDFVTTKNKALALATGAYILFMDADERLLAGHDILKQSAQHGEGAIGARIVEGEWPTVNNAYYRLRLWRNTDEWHFTGPGVHEVVMGPGAVTWHADVAVHHDHSHRTPQSYEQRYALYVRLLNTALAHDSNDLRAWFYLARTEKDAGHHLAAIAAYDEYLRRNPTWRDEIWQAHFDSALCWQQLGEYAKAFTALAQAVETDSRRAEAYCQRGDIYMLLGEWQNAAIAYEMALAQTEPTDVLLFHNPNTYKRYPADQLVLAYDKLHLYADGLRAAHMVLDAYPKPQTRLVNNLTWLRSMAERRWLFALGATPEPVYGDLLAHNGAGGVETTYIELPKALAAQGQRVFVACNCYAEHESDGVTFLPYTMLNEYLRWYHPQVLVASRWHDALLNISADQKILWLQDAWFGETSPAVWQSVRKVVVSSPWHRTYVVQRAGSEVARKTQVLPLGIRKAAFAELGVARKPHQLIYSSNPDRGLQTLVNAWPQITAAVPDVNLVITYGWEGLLTWSGDPTWQAQQETMHDRLTAWAEAVGNVTFTGRLPKAELYRQMAASAVCAYPNNFWETFCLTALECQAAGTPLITSALGALPTTCNPLSNILLGGDPQNAAYQAQFATIVSDLLLDNVRCQDMSAACLDYVAATPCDWSDIARQWLDLVWSDGIGV